MSYLKVYKNDLRLALVVAATIPVISFSIGFFTGKEVSSLQFANLTVEEKLSDQQKIKHTLVPVNQQAINIVPENQQAIKTPPNSETKIDTKIKSSIITSKLVDRQESTQLSNIKEAQQPSLKSINSYASYLIQAGRFSSYENAQKYQSKLAQLNLYADIVLSENSLNTDFILLLTSFDTEPEAKKYSRLVESLYQIDLYVRTHELKTSGENKSLASI